MSSVLESGVGEGRQKLSDAAVQQRIGQSLQVAVGLASRWPCVTDLVLYQTTGSTARKMSTPPKRLGVRSL